MKERLRKHKKKTIATISIITVLAALFQFWGAVYPMVCPLVSKPELCIATGKAAVVAGTALDANSGTVVLAPEPAHANDAGN